MKFDLPLRVLAGGILLLPSSYLFAKPLVSDSTAKGASVHSANSGQLSRDATNMLRKVDMAQKALSAKKTQEAISDINAALAERDQLAAASQKNGQSMIVPLYTELDDTSTLAPAVSARSGKAAPKLNAPITVDDASLQYTFVGLDLAKAKSRLDAAKMAIDNRNYQAASDSLSAIGTDLIMETNDDDLPLLAARENLSLAQTAVRKAQYSEASAALKQASAELSQYAAKSTAKHSTEAKALETKVDALATTVNQHHAGVASTLQSWWNEVDSWFASHT